MPKEAMTPRERWDAVFKRQKPDRIPMDYWATPETTAKLMEHLECSSKREMLEKLHVDFVIQANPRYIGPKIPRGYDVFGRRYKKMDYGTGLYKECVFHPLAEFKSVEEIKKNYKWPNSDWWDYSIIPKRIRGFEIQPVVGGHYEPFLIYKNLRGEEQSYMDLIINPEIVHYCLEKFFHLSYEEFQRIFEKIPDTVLFSYVAEDMGAQNDLLYSPAQIRDFLVPRMKLIIDLAHQAGAYVFHHNDGSIRRIIPDMIEAGIDILNPIQWRCDNMDREKLKQDFGDKVIFHGAMDNQHTLPFGTVSEVRQEVLDNFQILGKDGGYILAPCHNIQALSPMENIVAMYETGYDYGWT